MSVSTNIKKNETGCLFCPQKSVVQQENHGTMDKRTMTIYPPKPTTLRDYMRTFCKSMFTKPNGQTVSR